MLQRPAFKPSLTVEVVEPDGVFLLSEQSHDVLQGALYRRLAPLLDGRHTSDELVETLADVASPAEVCYALLRLEQRDFLAAPADGVPVERAAFWHAAGHDPVDAERRLCSSRVSIECFGTVDSEPLAIALRELGCSTGPSSGLDEQLTVVLTDDYLWGGLDNVNRRALEEGRYWLLAKPVGSSIWIGPLFRPGQGPCWECLAQRLRANREVDRYLLARIGQSAPFPSARARFPSAEQAAAQLIALEVARAVSGDDRRGAETTLRTMDLTTLAITSHSVVWRPQCPRCGTLDIRPERVPRPPNLGESPGAPSDPPDGQPLSLDETFERYRHHIDPITGALTHLTLAPPEERPYGYLITPATARMVGATASFTCVAG